MLRYNLASLPERRRTGNIRLQPIEDRAGTVRDYRAILRRMLREMADIVREGVVPQIEREMALMRDAPRDWFSGLFAAVVNLQRVAGEAVDRILGLEAERHTLEFMRTAKNALGVDLSSVVRQEDLGDYLDLVSARNAALIKGLADDTIRRIQQTVMRSVLEGESTRQLRGKLAADFGIMGRRADLIARDQTAKLNSDLNRIRQTQAGIEEYVWRTSHDERVRPRHRELDGKTYKWGESTGAEEGLPPGQPIQCRCVAIGVVKF